MDLPTLEEMAILWSLLFITLWWVNRTQEHEKKKKITPETIWLETCLDDCLTFGKPQMVYIRQDVWEYVVNKPMVHKYIGGRNPIISEHGLHNLTVIYTNGKRKDYDYPEGKRKNDER